MDLEGIMLSEISRRKTNTTCHHLHVESKKHNKLVNKTIKKQIYRYKEQNSSYQWREEREGNIGEGREKVIMELSKIMGVKLPKLA